MRVHIALQEDKEFRQHVKDMVAGEVRSILREQMHGIIQGELAKQRLLQPDSPSLNELIHKAIKYQVDLATRNVGHTIRDEVLAVAKAAVQPHMSEIKKNIREELVRIIQRTDVI